MAQTMITKGRLGLGGGLLAAMLAIGTVGTVAAATKTASFEMVPSGAAATCLPNASADVRIRSIGPVELMDVEVKGLPPKTEYDLFVTQVPNPPFGVSWYQGDLETNAAGRGRQQYIGRFNIETFAVAPDQAPAPLVHDDGTIQDATRNPAFKPIHTYHLGLWFNSPQDATKAGCPGATTPFNGEHTAGVQVLSTRNAKDDQGPLRQIEP